MYNPNIFSELKSNGWHYQDVLATILKTDHQPVHIKAIIQTIIDKGFNKAALNATLKSYGTENITHLQEDLLDLLITYAHIILDDHSISASEYLDFGLLKILFKIKEGDFYKKRHYHVQQIINDHLTYILKDGKISLKEAMEAVNIQDMFSLSYDQYEKFEKHFYQKFAFKLIPLVPLSEVSVSTVSKGFASLKAVEHTGQENEKLSEPKDLSYKYKSSSSGFQTYWSKAWGVVIVIVLGVIVAFLKKALKH